MKVSTSRYVDEFFTLKCAPQLLPLFPNGKEVTESMSVYNAIRRLKIAALDDSSTTVVVVGDGHSPRTGALCALRSAWQVVSIDPAMRLREYNIRRLTCLKDKVESLNLSYDKVVILAVHSHATMANTLEHINARKRSLVSMPCCVPYDGECDVEYVDEGVWSPKNTVKVWLNI